MLGAVMGNSLGFPPQSLQSVSDRSSHCAMALNADFHLLEDLVKQQELANLKVASSPGMHDVWIRGQQFLQSRINRVVFGEAVDVARDVA